MGAEERVSRLIFPRVCRGEGTTGSSGCAMGVAACEFSGRNVLVDVNVERVDGPSFPVTIDKAGCAF